VQDVTLGPVELSVVGPPEDPRSRELFGAARRIAEPRKLVHHDTTGRYPYRGRPAAYVCTRTACSSPIHDPAALPATVERLAAGPQAACP
jgi:uncharacterized protein YyaL (SSP411 family)